MLTCCWSQLKYKLHKYACARRSILMLKQVLVWHSNLSVVLLFACLLLNCVEQHFSRAKHAEQSMTFRYRYTTKLCSEWKAALRRALELQVLISSFRVAAFAKVSIGDHTFKYIISGQRYCNFSHQNQELTPAVFFFLHIPRHIITLANITYMH